MKHRPNIPLVVIAIILLIIIAKVFLVKNPSRAVEPFRNTRNLILTKHAVCRMNCRHITTREIKEVINEGHVNNAKSGVGSKGGPTYAIEGYSTENQHIRVVVAPENDGLVVITCIDLDHEWPCHCN